VRVYKKVLAESLAGYAYSTIIFMGLKVELRVRYLNQGLPFFEMLPIFFHNLHMYLQSSIAQEPFLFGI